MSRIDITIPAEITGLSKEEFLERYFDPAGDGRFECHVVPRRELFAERDMEKELLFESRAFFKTRLVLKKAFAERMLFPYP